MQLASIISDPDSDIVDENGQVTVDSKLVEKLRLAGEQKFPTRRLVTLWNHNSWPYMINRLLTTRVGFGIFNISMFEWMASLRIDEYWFAKLGALLDTLEALPIDAAAMISHQDWERLASEFSHTEGDTSVDVDAVFYATQGNRRVRTNGLLTSLKDAEYERLKSFLATTPDVTFSLPYKIKRQHGLYMTCILHHVVAWIDPASAAAINAQSHVTQNKTLIREHLGMALKAWTSALPPEDQSLIVEKAVELQGHVLDFARENIEGLQEPMAHGSSSDDGPNVDRAGYETRFSHRSWARLLTLVRDFVGTPDGHVLRPDWNAFGLGETPRNTEHIPALVRTVCSQVASAIARDEVGLLTPTVEATATLEQGIRESIQNYIHNIQTQHVTTPTRDLLPSQHINQDHRTENTGSTPPRSEMDPSMDREDNMKLSQQAVQGSTTEQPNSTQGAFTLTSVGTSVTEQISGSSRTRAFAPAKKSKPRTIPRWMSGPRAQSAK
jgi:hypothetical protein